MYYSLGKTSLKKAFIITFYILIIFSQFNFGDCWYVIDNSVLRNRCRFNWASWANQSGTWKDATRTRMEWTKKEMEKQLFVKKKDKKENQYFYEEKIEVTNNIFLFFFFLSLFFIFQNLPCNVLTVQVKLKKHEFTLSDKRKKCRSKIIKFCVWQINKSNEKIVF